MRLKEIVAEWYYLKRDYILDKGKLPQFHCWDNPQPVGKHWAFGWLTGIDNDLICIFPNIQTRVMENWALSPVHSRRIVAFLAFIAKRFLFLVDCNWEGL